jgi:hypothetical protein
MRLELLLLLLLLLLLYLTANGFCSDRLNTQNISTLKQNTAHKATQTIRDTLHTMNTT